MSRSRRGDYEDEDDDRPRRRRRDDDDEDDRPHSRRRDDDDDDPPRRQRRDDDEDDRPRRRRPRRKSRGPSTGLILGIVGGAIALVVVVVLVVVLARGGANISYAKFQGINSGATVESLEKQFGKATKLDHSEWSRVQYASDRDGLDRRDGRGGTLADLDPLGQMVDAWYHWHSGSEDIYVAVGKDHNGKTGLIMKVYTNSNAYQVNARAGGDFSKMVPNYEVLPVN